MILDNSSRKVYGGSVRFCKFDNILIKLVLVFSGSLGGILMVENFGYLVVRLDKSLIFRLLCFLHSKIIRDISEENKFIKWHNGHFMDCKMDFMGYHVGMDNIDAISETSGAQTLGSPTPTAPVTAQPPLTKTTTTTTRTDTYTTTTTTRLKTYITQPTSGKHKHKLYRHTLLLVL
eukprot:160886_1